MNETSLNDSRKINKHLLLETTQVSDLLYVATATIVWSGKKFKSEYNAKKQIVFPNELNNLVWLDEDGEKIDFYDIIKKSYKIDEDVIINKINSLIDLNDTSIYKIKKMTGLSQGSFACYLDKDKGLSPKLSSLIIIADFFGYKIKIEKNDE